MRTMYTILFLLGGASAILIGTFLPLGGGRAIGMIGVAAVGAALVLIGLSLEQANGKR